MAPWVTVGYSVAWDCVIIEIKVQPFYQEHCYYHQKFYASIFSIKEKLSPQIKHICVKSSRFQQVPISKEAETYSQKYPSVVEKSRRFESYELEIVQVLMWEDGIFTTITCPEVPQNNSHYFHQTRVKHNPQCPSTTT